MEVLVTDQDNHPLAGVAVARSDASQIRRSGEPDANGIWFDPTVGKGNYRIEATGAEAGTCHVKVRETAQCKLVVEGGH